MQGQRPPTFPPPKVPSHTPPAPTSSAATFSAPTFSSPEAKRAFERQEAAREEVHPLDWADDFGPLKYTELTKFVMHMQRIERARDDAAEEHALAVAAGYTDASHFRRVRATFRKYWGAPNGSDVLREFGWKEPEFSQAIMGSMQLEREESAEAALAKNPELLAPEEGLSLESYAALCAQMAGRQVAVEELQQLLARVSLDVPKWERVNKAWVARMGNDPTGTVTMAFTKAYTAAGAGQFGAAAQAASRAMGSAPGTAPSGPEPMSLERYAEIGVAMAAWTRQGNDVHAMMMQVFQINAGDLSNVGMYWHQRFAADVTLLGRYGRLQDELKAKYEEADPDADLVY